MSFFCLHTAEVGLAPRVSNSLQGIKPPSSARLGILTQTGVEERESEVVTKDGARASCIAHHCPETKALS